MGDHAAPEARAGRAGSAALHPVRLPKTVGEWISELRLARRKVVAPRRASGRSARETVRGWARIDLAELASISEPTLYRIETDLELPGYQVFESLLNALEVWPWQRQMLREMWLARVANVTSAPRLSAAARRSTIELMSDLPYPAVVLDELHALKACNRLYDSVVGANHPRAGLLSYFEPGTQMFSVGAQQLLQEHALRRFLLHTARWSMLPRYVPTLVRLERVLVTCPTWHAGIHSDEPDEERGLRRHIPDLGDIEFLSVDRYRNVGRSVVLRIWLPLPESAECYARLLAVVGSGGEPAYVAPDWRN